MTSRGFALLNGSAVAGNVKVGLYDRLGRLVAESASTAQSGTAAFQRINWTKSINLTPGTYYVGVTFDNTGARFRAHPFGNFGATKATGLAYGTLPKTISPPTTFTTNLAPVGGLF